VRQRKAVLGFVRNAAKINAGITIGQMRMRNHQRLVEALLPSIEDLDAMSRLLRKQCRQFGPCRFGGRGPIGKYEVALPEMKCGINLALRERAAVDGCQAQRAWRLGAIRTLAQHRHTAVVGTDRQVCVCCLIRQEFISDQPAFYNGQQIEGEARRERMMRSGSDKVRANHRQ
jgi:hypothetical protein